MTTVERNVDRLLDVLRTTIRESGWTQVEIQRKLGWGRSYISQILGKQKNVYIDQVALILKVIGVEPGDFYAKVFPPSERPEPPRGRPARRQIEALRRELAESWRHEARLGGLVSVLVTKGVITEGELERAVEAAGKELASEN